MNNVALYARVSTEAQAEKELPITAQVDQMRAFAKAKGWRCLDEYIFIDAGVSARTADRPDFQRMIALAKSPTPPFQKILVWKYSRFARNRDDSSLYKALLRRRGVELISISEPIDDSPSGRLLEGMIEIIDEFYSLNLAEDVKRGLKAAAGQGWWLTAKRPWGYDVEEIMEGERKRKRLTPDPLRAPTVQRIFQMALEGHSLNQIQRTLKDEGLDIPTRIHDVLHNPAYTGKRVYGRRVRRGGRLITTDPSEWQVVEDAHPGIIKQKLFDSVQEALTSRDPEMNGPPSAKHAFAGLAKCGRCGAALVYGTRYYYCSTRMHDASCSQPSVDHKLVLSGFIVAMEGQVFDDAEAIKRIVADAEEQRRALERGESLAALEKQMGELRKRETRLYDAIERGVEYDEVEGRLKALREEKALLQVKIEAKEPEASYVPITARYLKDSLRLLIAQMHQEDTPARREAIRALCSGIVVDHPRVYATITLGGVERKVEYWVRQPPATPEDVSALTHRELAQHARAIRRFREDKSLPSTAFNAMGKEALIQWISQHNLTI